MNVEFFSNGTVKNIKNYSYDIPFSKEHGLGFYLNGEFLKTDFQKYGIEFSLDFLENSDYVTIIATVKNTTDKDIKVDNLGLRLGIDTYMESYPEWNAKFFPTMLRCEKTHFWGYFMNPGKKCFAISVTEPVASYHLEYNANNKHFGHRIYPACLDFFKSGKLPLRNPVQNELKAGEEYRFNVYIIPLSSENEIGEKLSTVCNIPVISSSKYTIELNDTIEFNVFDRTAYSYEIISPSGKLLDRGDRATEYGEYTIRVKNEHEKIAESVFFCRKPWDFYLKSARKEAIRKPQKASTHCESWYGFFSGFLAQKHYPNEVLDKKINSLFDEVLPLIVDVESGTPMTSPTRIQNMSALISLLTDKYEATHDEKTLILAAKIADYILRSQTDEGAYCNKNVHYTCVIYIAKSILELVLAERKSCNAVIREKAEIHYDSAKRAIDELLKNLECIGTEGEHTLEDGMISCSALQLGMLALMLPENERGPYIDAAEYMINRHCCLEQNIIPDARMNGCSLRFWEAQYDVLFKANFMNSPHGWTAWTIYAKYYLYMLTGKAKYLKEAANAMGACAQLIDLDGNLRWGFCVEPYIEGDAFVADKEKSVKDGYISINHEDAAYRGKFQPAVIGEEYVDMISGWYRCGEQKVTGAYDICPLINEKGEYIQVDIQGGCCDNDVHEIFKCLEETFLNKAFAAREENGEIYTIGCRYENNTLYVPDGVELFANFDVSEIKICHK